MLSISLSCRSVLRARAILYYAFANLTYVFVKRPYMRLRDVKLGHTDVRSGNVAISEAVELRTTKVAKRRPVWGNRAEFAHERLLTLQRGSQPAETPLPLANTPPARPEEVFHLQVTNEATTARLVALTRNTLCLAHK